MNSTIQTKLLEKVGTLSHNRTFTLGEFREYTGLHGKVLSELLSNGFVEVVQQNVFRLTTKGYNMLGIE